MSTTEPILAFKKTLFAWVRHLPTGAPTKIIKIPERPFGVPLRPDLIQRVVVWYRAGIRKGTASTKTRGEVMGSGKKLRPNNNVGKARVGDSRSPIRRGGGICHGPKPRDWAFPIPEPVFQKGFMSALAAKYQQNQLLVIDHQSLNLSGSNPRCFLKLLSTSPHIFAKTSKLLFLDTWPFPETFVAATARLPNAYHAMVQDDLNAYHLLNNDLLILTERAVHYYSKQFQAKAPIVPKRIS